MQVEYQTRENLAVNVTAVAPRQHGLREHRGSHHRPTDRAIGRPLDSRGMFVRMEKTVPLDRITDPGLVQGPLVRPFDIEALSIETAGKSSHGAVVQLAGIKDGRKIL